MKQMGIVLLFSCVLTWTLVTGKEDCVTLQYVEVGSTGIIECSFQEDFYGIIWYNSTDRLNNEAILVVENSQKSGRGFLSGDFDVFPNGSLIVKNVSIKHEGTYTVIKYTPTTKTPSYFINVSVIAPTFSRVPVISNCENESETCFQILDQHSTVSCTVRDGRPPVSLALMVRTIQGDRDIPFNLSVTNGTQWPFFTSRVTTTNPFSHSMLLTLTVCIAEGLPDLLHQNESQVLIQNGDRSHTNLETVSKYLEISSRLELKCTEFQISYLVWQLMKASESEFTNILYGVFVGKNFTQVDDEEYKLTDAGSLVVNAAKIQHEGIYRCISGDGFVDDVAMYDVSVFVIPDPAYLIIDGCTVGQYCVLEAHVDGNLTCTLNKVRPKVKLDFIERIEGSSEAIQFLDKTLTVTESGDTFDVTLTSKYHLHVAATTRRTVECYVVGANIDRIQLSTKFDLWFYIVHDTTYTTPLTEERLSPWIIAVVVLVVSLLLVLFCFAVIREYNKRSSPTDSSASTEEDIPMFSSLNLEQSCIQEKRKLFIRQLKGKYEDLYNAVQPIPYIKDRLFCVDRVFVEGGLQFLVSTGSRNWEMLETYHNIFNNSEIKSSRRILEGEPGYGKSTLTLQLTYDWCNRTINSPLKDTEILILLRLRQLGRVSSIYRGIKQFILPGDSQLTEGDIKTIVTSTPSTVIILDGYDEYPDQNDNASDINNIIRRQMFQDFDVILTTRSSCLPTKYAPQTKRVRMTGFNDQARDAYIKKAVVGNDSVATEKIKQRLGDNPVLGDLCQAPLFFVLFAHMSHENEGVLTFDSVTSFFRHMISCFHTHLKNKMEDENVEQFELFETNHQALDAIAFEGLSGKNQQIVWSKERLRKRLGENFYDQYISIGILVEEEILKIRNIPGTRMTEHIQRKTEVRFYHKLFCEWYAAHFLSENAVKLSREDLQTFLENVDSFDLQFVYRFACGLDTAAADKIIAHLQSTKEGKKFAILCILEKTGDVDKMTETVSQLCSRQVSIGEEDKRLLQRSTIQLLGIASRNEISISHVSLYYCYSTVYLSGGYHLQLKSNLYIPVLTTLNKLTIHEDGREISVAEFTDILQYSSKCLALKELVLIHCLLPQSVQAESVSILRSRNVKVIWRPRVSTWYRLNLQSCLWEHFDVITQCVKGVMTDDDYQSEVTWFRKRYGKE